MIKKHIDAILNFGFDAVCDIHSKSLVFNSELRKLCKKNVCGNYCRNYACPPICGTPEEMENITVKYDNVMVLQKKVPIVTNLDLDKIQEDVRNCMYEVVDYLNKENFNGIASAPGPCRLCKECGAVKGTQCKHPDKIMSCISAYCIDAKAMAEICGMQYDGGEKEINFFCLYFYGIGDTK